MKLKTNLIAFAIATASGAGLANAIATNKSVPGHDNPVSQSVLPAYQQKVQLKGFNKDQLTNTQKYFVYLKDAPVALYTGTIAGFAATRIDNSHGKNKTAKGKLNLKSKESIAYLDYLSQKQVEFKKQLKTRLKRELDFNHQFKTALNAVTVELTEGEAKRVKSMPGVLEVVEENKHQLHTDRGPEHVGATSVWSGNVEYAGSQGEGVVVGIMDTGIRYNHPAFADIGGDGYDHSNPNGSGVYFGSCNENPDWCNDKLLGVVGFPEVDAAFNSSFNAGRYGMGQDGHGHGTHVASTVAGNVIYDSTFTGTHQPFNSDGTINYDASAVSYTVDIDVPEMSGIAPHANIVSYQVCHPTEGCFASAALQAIEHAMENGIDVLNYSVGGSARSPWLDPVAIAMRSAREAGIHIAVSAGNAGPNAATVGSPGNSPWVTTVAASTHDRGFNAEKSVSFSGGDATLATIEGVSVSKGVTAEVVSYADLDAGYIQDTYGDGACLSNIWGELTGKIIVCQRGGHNYNGAPVARTEVMYQMQRAGAAGVILINTDQSVNDVISPDMAALPTIHVNKADGEAILAWLSSGSGHTATITAASSDPEFDLADMMSSFSSRGPDALNGDYLVPDITAPGVDIHAAGIGFYNHYYPIEGWAKVQGDYRFMSGTSMSSPHIAGMLALIAAVHPEWSPAEAQSAFMTTAVPARDHYDAKGDYSEALADATPLDAGGGSARVDRAINAVLLLNETEQGYLAAHPFAGEWGISNDIPGWHGDASRLNMASLSKSDCLMTCSWTRTVKATKAGSWTLSGDAQSDGIEILVSPAEITLAAGEEFEINVTANLLAAQSEEWSRGQIKMIPSDSSMPTQHLTLAVNFIAGIAPEKVNLVAKRDRDTVTVGDVMTIGTEDLQVSKTELARADRFQFELMKDTSNNTVFDTEMESNTFAVQINVQAHSPRLIAKILNTDSPDVDLYLGYDLDLDGKPSVSDSYVYAFSAGADSNEVLEIKDPQPGTYWLMVHNFDAPVQAVDEEGNPIVDEAGNPVYEDESDNVELLYGLVKYDDDSMSVSAPSSVAPLEELALDISWDIDATQGDYFFGLVEMGTSYELPKNIGVMDVDLIRMEDDVQLTTTDTEVLAGQDIGYQIMIASNQSGKDRNYQLSTQLPIGYSVVASDRAEVNDNSVSWELTQIAGAQAQTISLTLGTDAVEGLDELAVAIDHQVEGIGTVETATAEKVIVEGRPSVSVSTSSLSVDEGQSVTLAATGVGVLEDDQLTYRWVQVSGPAVVMANAEGDSITLVMPKVSSNETVVLQVIATNGRLESLPATASIEVVETGGGSLGFLLLPLVGLLILRKRS